MDSGIEFDRALVWEIDRKTHTPWGLWWNVNPKPFIRMATIESTMEKLSRCKQTLEEI